MLILRNAVFLTGMWLAVSSSPAMAQSSPRDSLAALVDSLQHRVTELERRVAALEGATRGVVERKRPSNGNSSELANWRRLREGMSYDAVRRILGEPDRIAGGTLAFWSYPNGGQVSFSSGRLRSWSEPAR